MQFNMYNDILNKRNNYYWLRIKYDWKYFSLKALNILRIMDRPDIKLANGYRPISSRIQDIRQRSNTEFDINTNTGYLDENWISGTTGWLLGFSSFELVLHTIYQITEIEIRSDAGYRMKYVAGSECTLVAHFVQFLQSNMAMRYSAV